MRNVFTTAALGLVLATSASAATLESSILQSLTSRECESKVYSAYSFAGAGAEGSTCDVIKKAFDSDLIAALSKGARVASKSFEVEGGRVALLARMTCNETSTLIRCELSEWGKELDSGVSPEYVPGSTYLKIEAKRKASGFTILSAEISGAG